MRLNLDHDLECEQAILGAFFVDESAIDAVPELEPPWFFLGAHQEIARCVLQRARARQPFDPVSVHMALQAERKIPDVVPAEMVFDLARGVGTAAKVEHYVGELRNLWAMRQARLLAHAFTEDVSTVSAEAAISALQRDLSAIETGRGARAVTAGELVAQMIRELEDEATGRPGTEIVSTGFRRVDELVGGFEPGILHVYAARPGVGKSCLALSYARALGEAGIPVAVYWWEDTARKFALRIAAAVGEIPAAMLRHGRNMRAPWWDRLHEAQARIADWPIYVESTKGVTAAQACRRLRRLRREKGIRVAIADHLGEVAFEDDGERNDLALGRAAGLFRDEADALGVCPVLLHQLNKAAETDRGPPRLGWLFNSDVIGQKGRVVGFMSRDGVKVEITFVKATYAEPGTVVELAFEPNTMRLTTPFEKPVQMGIDEGGSR